MMERDSYKMMWDFLRGWIEVSITHDIKSVIDYEAYGRKENPEYIRGYTDCDILISYLMEIMEQSVEHGDFEFNAVEVRLLAEGFEECQKKKTRLFEAYIENKVEVEE